MENSVDILDEFSIVFHKLNILTYDEETILWNNLRKEWHRVNSIKVP